MTWGIIGALNSEIAMLKSEMDISREVEIFGTTFYVGKICNQDVVLVCCSIGKVNAALCAYTVIREFGAQKVVNIGIAGAVDKSLGIFDVVISKDLVFHDSSNELMGRYYPFNTVFEADKGLTELCVKAIESIEDREYEYYIERIATGDVFVQSSELKDKIWANYKPFCVEMEGAAIAQVSYMNKVPFLVIRSMSDRASESAEQLYDNFFEMAAQNSALIVLTMLELAD